MCAFRLVALCVLLLASVSPVYADTKTLTADASYIMGDGETPSFAEAMALQKAKQTALEEAGTYVQSYTKSVNQDLTKDEIQTLAGGVMQVEVLEKARSIVADGFRFYTKIKATVTTDKMEELALRIKGKNVAVEYTQLQDEYARLSRELANWKQRAAKAPQGMEREAALDQIREEAKAFARAQQREAEFFQRVVSGKQLVQRADREREIIDGLIQTIVRSGYVMTVGNIKALPLSGKSDTLVINVPLTMKVSDSLHEAATIATQALGGTVLTNLTVSLMNGRNLFPLQIGTESGYGIGQTSDGKRQSFGPKFTVNLVRIARDLETANYFQDEVMRQTLVVIFLNGEKEVSSCHLGSRSYWKVRDWFELRRIFPVQNMQHGGSHAVFGNGSYELDPEMNSYSGSYSNAEEKGYVAIVNEEVTFVAQHRLPAQLVRNLTGVRISAISISAQDKADPNTCAIAQ